MRTVLPIVLAFVVLASCAASSPAPYIGPDKDIGTYIGSIDDVDIYEFSTSWQRCILAREEITNRNVSLALSCQPVFALD